MNKIFDFLCSVFPSRHRKIPAVDKGFLMEQFKITDNLYLQRFLKPELERVFHFHRWEKMRSFVLSGWYEEERLYLDRTTKKIIRKSFSSHSMTKDVIHRISKWSNKCVTLFWMRGGGTSWGYTDPEFNYTPWEDYIPENKKVDSL